MNHSLKIGVNPICWTNDDMPTLGGHISLEQCLQEASHIGFSGIELGSRFPKQPEILYPLLDQHQLELITGWYSGELLGRSAQLEWEMMQEHITLLKAMDCEIIIYAETAGCIHKQKNTPLAQRPKMTLMDWHHYGEKLSQLAKWAAQLGLHLVVHHHMGTVIQTQEEIGHLMLHTSEEVGLLLDTGHLIMAGGDIAAIIKAYGHRIKHVHFKDVRTNLLHEVDETKDSFLDAVISSIFTVPSDGNIDFIPILKQLAAIKYQGWLIIEAEQYSDHVPAAVFAKKGFDYLKHSVQKTMTLNSTLTA